MISSRVLNIAVCNAFVMYRSSSYIDSSMFRLLFISTVLTVSRSADNTKSAEEPKQKAASGYEKKPGFSAALSSTSEGISAFLHKTVEVMLSMREHTSLLLLRKSKSRKLLLGIQLVSVLCSHSRGGRAESWY